MKPPTPVKVRSLNKLSDLINKTLQGEDSKSRADAVFTTCKSFLIDDKGELRVQSRSKFLESFEKILRPDSTAQSVSRYLLGAIGDPTNSWKTQGLVVKNCVRIELDEKYVPTLYLPDNWSFNDPLIDYIAGLVTKLGGKILTYVDKESKGTLSNEKEYVDLSPSLGLALIQWFKLPNLKLLKHGSSWTAKFNKAIKFHVCRLIVRGANKEAFLKGEVKQHFSVKKTKQIEQGDVLSRFFKFGKTNVWVTLGRPLISSLVHQYMTKKANHTVVDRNWFVTGFEVVNFSSFNVKEIERTGNKKKEVMKKIKILPKNPYDIKGLFQDERLELKTYLMRYQAPYKVFADNVSTFDKKVWTELRDSDIAELRSDLKMSYDYYYGCRRLVRKRNKELLNLLKKKDGELPDLIGEIEKSKLIDFADKNKVKGILALHRSQNFLRFVNSLNLQEIPDLDIEEEQEVSEPEKVEESKDSKTESGHTVTVIPTPSSLGGSNNGSGTLRD